MADLKEIILKIGAQVDTAYVEYENLKNKIKELIKANSELDTSLQKNVQTFKTNAEAIKAMKEQMSSYKDYVKQSESVLKDYANAVKTGAVSINETRIPSEVISDITNLKTQIDETKKYIESLKQENKAAAVEMKNLGTASRENAVAYEELNSKIETNKETIAASEATVRQLNNEYKEQNRQLDLTIKVQSAAEGSLKQMQGQLSLLNAEYARLSKEERENSDIGGKLKAEIQELSKEYKGLQMEIGNTYVNVGNYEQAISNAIGANKGLAGSLTGMAKQAAATGQSFGTVLVKGIQGVGSAMLKLLANPLILVIAGIAAIIMGIVKAIKSNEESVNRLSAAFAPLKRLLDGVLSVFQAIGGALISVIEFLGKMAGGISTLMEKLPFVGKFIKEANEESAKAIQLEKDKQALVKTMRDDLVKNAEAERDIAKARLIAADKENYTAEERLEALKKANKLEMEITDREIAASKEKLRIAEAEAKRTKNSAETEQKLAELRAEVIQKETEGYTSRIKLAKQLQNTEKEIADDRKKEEEDKQKKAEEWQKIYQDNVKKIRDLEIAAIADNQEREKKAREAKLADDLAAIKGSEEQKAEMKKLLTEQAEKEIADIEKKYAELKNKDFDAEQKLIEERIKSQLELRIQLAQKGSEEEMRLKNEKLDIELQNSIKKAEERAAAELELAVKNGKDRADAELAINAQLEIDKTLLEQQAAQERQTWQDEFRKQQMEIMAEEKQLEFENELMLLGEQEDAKAQLVIENEERKLQAARDRYNEYLAMDADAKQKLGVSETQLINQILKGEQSVSNATKAAMDLQKQRIQQNLEALSVLSGAMKDLFGEIAGDSEELAGFQKAMALFEIGINTAKAIVSAIAGATEAASAGGPAAPFLLIGYIATMVGAVVSAVVQAKKTLGNEPKAPKFAKGGIVGGSGTGTSDSNIIKVSKGESIMTAKATQMFAPALSAMNVLGGGEPFEGMSKAATALMTEESMYRSMKAALREELPNMPNPQVAVTEIQDVNNRVEVVEDLRNA